MRWPSPPARATRHRTHARFRRLLEALGLSRPELRAWAMYDWANSAMVCTIITAVFPIYYSKVACAGLEPEDRLAAGWRSPRRSAWSSSPCSRRSSAPSPTTPRGRSGCSAIFLALGLASVAGDVLHPHRRLAAGLGPLHPGEHRRQRQLRLLRRPPAAHRPRRRDRPGLDRRLRAGIPRRRAPAGAQPRLDSEARLVRPPVGREPQRSQATLPARLAFLSVAIWWLVFSIPLFRRVPEPKAVPSRPRSSRSRARSGPRCARLGETVRELRRYRQGFLMLLAFLIYNDGIGTIIRMATIYGAELEHRRRTR